MNKTFAVLITVFLMVLPVLSYADEYDSDSSEMLSEEWGASASVTYESGDFGTDETTQTTYIPLTLKRYFPKGDVGWTIPFIHQKSTPGVSAIRGRPFRTSPSTAGNRRTESGLGDMLLKGRYYLFDEEEHEINVNPIVQIKFPTADDDKGLGTGEFDETFGLENSKTLNEDWLLFLDLYYTFIGEPDGANLNDEFAIAVGPGYYVSEQTMLSLLYGERTNLVDGEDNPRELIFGINHQLEDTLGAQGFLSVGLSDGSPDVGVTVGINKQF